MLQAITSSSTAFWALVVIIVLLLGTLSERKKRIEKLLGYLRDADDNAECERTVARYWRHLLFARLARHYPSGLKRMEGGMSCFIDLPTGQVSMWFAHDRHDPGLTEEERQSYDFETEAEIAKLYYGLTEYTQEHDGHSMQQMVLRLGGKVGSLGKENPIPEIPLRG